MWGWGWTVVLSLKVKFHPHSTEDYPLHLSTVLAAAKLFRLQNPKKFFCEDDIWTSSFLHHISYWWWPAAKRQPNKHSAATKLFLLRKLFSCKDDIWNHRPFSTTLAIGGGQRRGGSQAKRGHHPAHPQQDRSTALPRQTEPALKGRLVEISANAPDLCTNRINY